jgi:hypothetical protein
VLYAIATDVPLQFDPGTVEAIQPRGLYAQIIERLAQKQEVTNLVARLYQQEVEAIDLPIYYLIGSLLSSELKIPKSLRYKTVAELVESASLWIHKLPDPKVSFGPDPIALSEKIGELIALRRQVCEQIKTVAGSDMTLLLRTNLVLIVLDRLIRESAKFAPVSFLRDDFDMSLVILGEAIHEVKKYRCFSTVKHFFTDHFGQMCEHLDEFLSLLDAVRENLHARKPVKAEQAIRAHALFAKWIGMHLTEEDAALNIPSFDGEFHLPKPDVETDGIDLGMFRLPLVPIMEDVETNPDLVRCRSELANLSYNPFKTLVFFRKWFAFFQQLSVHGSVYAEIEQEWNFRLKPLRDKDPFYKSPLVLLQCVSHYSQTLTEILTTASLAASDSALVQFCTAWISYFCDLKTQFARFADEYSSRILHSHLGYLKQVEETLTSFKDGAAKLDQALPQYGIWFIGNSIHVCVVRLLDFLMNLEKEEPGDLTTLFKKCYQLIYFSELSIERLHPDIKFLPFYQTFGHLRAVFLRVMTRFAQTTSFSRQKVAHLKHFILEICKISHLGAADTLRSLVESLSVLYARLWKRQTQESAISDAILSCSNILIRLADRLAANIDGDVLDASEVPQARTWVSYLREKELAFASLVSLYETERPAEIRTQDMQHFQHFLSEFETIHARSSSLVISNIADDARNSLINVISSFETADSSDFSGNIPYLSGGFRDNVSSFDLGSIRRGVSNFSQQVMVSLHSSNGLGGSGGNSPLEHRLSSDSFSLNSRNKVKSDVLHYRFRIQTRSSILKDPNSPINQQPSGRHVTFSEASTQPSHPLTGPAGIDPDMFIPVVQTPPFISWNLTALQAKVGTHSAPNISYSGSANFQPESFTLPPFRDVKDYAIPDLMDLLDPHKKPKKPPIGRRSSRRPVEHRSSLTTGSDIANAVISSTRRMRNISKALREGESDFDTYGELEFIHENRKELLEALPTMVKGQNISPNEEFVLDAVREYETIRIRFAEITEAISPNPEILPLKAVIESCGKQLSLVGVSLTHYTEVERISTDARFSRMIPRILGFISETFQSLQLIIDAGNEPCVVTNAPFFAFLGRSFFQLSQFFDELETVVQKSILAYARDALVSSLKRINTFCQRFDNLDKPGDLGRILAQTKSVVTALVECVTPGSSDLSICAELVRDSISHGNPEDPCILFDLDRMTELVESNWLSSRSRTEETALIELVKLRCHLMITHTTSTGEIDRELCDRLKDVEDDLNGLVASLQAETAISGSQILHDLAPKWKDSIHRMILNVAEIRTSSSLLRQAPQLYQHVETFLERLTGALCFFETPRGVDVSHVYFDLVERLARARLYARRAHCRAPILPTTTKYLSGGFTRVAAGRTVRPTGMLVVRVLDVLRRTFVAARSTAYCGELAQLIADAHLRLSPEEFELAVANLPPPGVDSEAISNFARAKLTALLSLLGMLAKLAEVELRLLLDVKMNNPFRSAEWALEEFKQALASVLEVDLQPLPRETLSFETVMEELKPFYAEIAKIAPRLTKMQSQTREDFEATEDAVDGLRYIAKTGMPPETVSVLFDGYLREFEARNVDGFVPEFVKFFQRASYVPLLRDRAVELKDELIQLLLNVWQNHPHAEKLETVIRLNSKIIRRVKLLESEDISVVVSILASELVEFAVPQTDGPTKFVSQNICNLVGIFLNRQGGVDIDKAKDMAIAFEQMADLCKGEVAVVDEVTRHKFWEIIDKAFKLVPPDAMGAFQPKMNLLLFLFHTQQTNLA